MSTKSKKRDYRYAQLTRGAFMINGFLRNPNFSLYCNEQTKHFRQKSLNLAIETTFCQIKG